MTPSNPFCTRCVRPGAMPYLFPPGVDAADLLERLRAHGCGALVGPHGTGKSTLLATLVQELHRTGIEVLVHTLHDGTRRLPDFGTLRPGGVLAIDGYEQLPWWRRWLIQRRCRQAGIGLLATAHHDIGLPLLYRTEVSVPIAQQVVAGLLADRASGIQAADVARCLAESQGNLREALFRLYDLHEHFLASGGRGLPGDSRPPLAGSFKFS